MFYSAAVLILKVYPWGILMGMPRGKIGCHPGDRDRFHTVSVESICISLAIVSCEYGLLLAGLELFSTIGARKGPLHSNGSLKCC